MARSWRCYNNTCRATLGTIVQGELVLDAGNENIAHINTEGAFVNITCVRCGRVNRWVPKDSDLVSAVMNTHLVRELLYQVRILWDKGANGLALVEEEELDADQDSE